MGLLPQCGAPISLWLILGPTSITAEAAAHRAEGCAVVVVVVVGIL